MKTFLPARKKLPFVITAILFWLVSLVTGISTTIGQSSQTFNSNGTFTVPQGVTTITVEAWGGGGRGGSRTTNGAGGGGGGGAYSRSVLSVTPGATYSVAVGAGSNSTTSGGDSWFGNATLVMAKGGNSCNNNITSGAQGGQAAQGFGDVKYNGGNGANAGSDGGGGGSSAGTNANGNNASGTGGAGAPAGGGNGGNGRSGSQGNGSAGATPGGGGGGGKRTSSGGRSGGTGANGRVVVSWQPAYAAEFVSMNTGSNIWCPGETRNVSVTIKNIGQAAWTDDAPDINIGVKWNSNGANWADYYVRTNAGNLAPGATATYTLPLTASNNAGGGYTTPFPSGSVNNIIFDVVYEGVCWFANNAAACGPGNATYVSPSITIGGANAITGSSELCLGATTTLTANAVGTAPLSYTWNSSNPAVATVINTGLVTAVSAGTTNITYTVTNGNGCTQTSPAFSFTVNESAVGTLTATETSGTPNDNRICAGSNVTFTATAGYVMYHFKVNGVTAQNGTARIFNTSTLNNGDVVTVDVTHPSSCVTQFNPITITVDPLPTGSLTAVENSGTAANDNIICAGDEVTFTATPGFAHYVFMVNGSGVQSGAANTFSTTTLTGTATVTVQATNGDGCTAVLGQQIITVNTIPGGTVTVTENSGVANNNEVCAGDAATFTATPGFANYNFYVNGTSVQNGASNVLTTAALVNPSIVNVQATTGGGCAVNLGPVVVSVHDLPSGTLSAFEGSGIPDDNVICAGETVLFAASAGFNNYEFRINGFTVQNSASNQFTTNTLNNGDVVTVMVSGDGGCMAEFNPVVINVDALPSTAITVSETSGTPNNNEICAGDEVVFTAVAGAANYQFLLNGSVYQNGASNQFFTSSLNNGDVITVEITGTNGCVITATAPSVLVNTLPSGSIALTETSGLAANDGIICSGDAATFTATPGFASYDFKVDGITVQNSASNVFVSTTLNNFQTIAVWATTAAGCSAELDNIQITVNDLPVGTLTATETSNIPNDNIICAGESVTFTATPGFDTYIFKVDGIMAQSGAANVFTTTSLVNNALVTVDVTNTNQCVAQFDAVAITVLPLPTGTLIPVENSGNTLNDGIICVDATVNFTAPAGYDNYTFFLNGAPVQSGASNVYTNSSLSDGDVVGVDVTHLNGCEVSLNNVVITVHTETFLPEIIGNNAVCKGATITLSNTVTGGAWSSMNTFVATVNPLTGVVTGVNPGFAEITYTFVNNNGCPSYVSHNIQVFALPVPTLSGPNPFCPETVAIYTTEPGMTNYVWTVTGGTIMAGGTSADNTIQIDWNLPGLKSIFVNYTNANGCSGATSTTVTGSTGTIPVLSGNNTACELSTGHVYTTQAGQTNYSWSVTGGTITAGGGSNDHTATITFTTPGIQQVSVNFQDMNGCSAASPTVLDVRVYPLPLATIAGTAQVCVGATSPSIVFTGSNSNAPYTFAYTINGGAVQNISTVSGNSVSLPVSTATAGTFVYELVSVTGNTGCAQAQSGTATITVTSLPTASISGTTAVCAGTPASVTFTGANGNAPYTFTYSINGGAAQTATTVSGNNISVNVNTASAGIFNYALLNVSDANGCAQDATGNAVITVNALPTATISGNAEVCINAAAPSIVFTGAGGIAPYTFAYNINGGATQTIVSVGNTAVLNVPTASAGNFQYNLLSVTDASSTNCVQSQSGAATVVVHPASVGGSIAGGTSVCTGVNATLLTLSGYTGNIIGWEYSTNGGSTWLPIANITAAYNAQNLTQTTQFRALVQSGVCAVAYASSATITVVNTSAGGSVSGSATVCAGTNSGNLTVSGYTGSILRWESSINGGASWNNIAHTGNTYTFNNLNTTTHFRAVVANAPCGEATSTAAVVTVNARPTGVLSGSGDMCLGAGTNLTLTVTGSGTISGTLSGGIAFSGTAPVINIPVNPAVNTTYTLVSLSDDNCTASAADMQGSATIQLLTLPDVFTVSPASANICAGTVQPLTATGTVPTNGTATASSGNINVSIPDAGLFGSGYTTRNLNISGIPAGAVITSVNVNMNISHSATGDLNINLRAPNGNILNLADNRGGTGNNFTNTNFNSGSTNPLSGSSNPYTGTFRADGSNNVGPGGGWNSNVTTFPQLFGVPNGNWTLIVEDNVWFRGFLQTNTGTLQNWSITISYTVPSNLASTWWPYTGLFSDPGATVPYSGQSLTTVYASPAAGTHTYTATFSNAQGCGRTASSTIVVNPAPVVTITADYCAVAGKVLLTATSTPAATAYLWSTGETTQSIAVDEANQYEVMVTTSLGCPGYGSMSIAQELVVNGDFEMGNTGFFTEYTLANGFNLYPEGEYAVGTDAHLYHDNFYGKDHTTPAQTGNFLMVNGSSSLIGSPGRLRTIWQQTVTVQPYTDYYFSAWAMNLNPGSPARLQFEVNGVPVGTIADLNVAPKPTSQAQVNINNWVRFYSNPTWNSGANTSAVIRIINLNTDPGGNDFGLDDISFGTLQPFIHLISGPGTDAQTVCANTAIEDVVYSVAGGSNAPTVTGLPAGVTAIYNGVSLTLSGSPATPGTYGYNITTTGSCNPITVTGTITVEQQQISLSSGSGAQQACLNLPIAPVQYTLSGTATGATVSGLPAGVTGTVSGNVLTISGTPTATGMHNFTINTTGTCAPVSTTGSINVQQQTISLFSGNPNQTRCINTAITNIVYATGGTATGATVTGLPAGVTANYSGGLVIISGTPTAAGTFNYVVNTTGGCNAVTETGTITVSPAATIALTSGAGSNLPVLCLQSSLTPIIYAIGGSATGASVTGLPAGITGTYNSGVFTISGTPSVAGIFHYTVSTTGACAAVIATGTITIQQSTVSVQSGTPTQTLCANTAINPVSFAIGGVATGATASNLPPGVTGTFNSGVFTLSGTPTVAGTYNYVVSATGGCAGTTAGGTFHVGIGSVGGTLADVFGCYNTSGTITLTGHSGNIIRWEKSVDGGATWTNIANTTTSQAYTNITTTEWYRVRIQNGSCPVTYSNVGMVAVANSWTGAVSSDWFDAANWTNNTLPSAICADAIIPAVTAPAHSPMLTGGVGTVHNLHILPGASFIVSNGTLEIAGTINNQGAFDVLAGTINMNGTTAQHIPAGAFTNNALGNLVIGNNSASGVSLQGDLDVYGSVNFTATGTRFSTNDQLTLKSTANNTAWVGNLTGKTFEGEVTVERYINTGTIAGAHPKSWQLLAVPTHGSQTVQQSWQEGAGFANQNNTPGFGTMITSNLQGALGLGFDAYTPAGGTMKTYNAATNAWDGIPSTTTTPIANQKGYMVLVRGDRSVITAAGAPIPTVLRTKGSLYTPDAVTPPVTTVPAGKFESVGNPFASAIDLTNSGVQRVNLADVFYVWDPQLTNQGVNSSYGLGAYQTFTLGLDGNYHVTPGGGSYGAGGSIRNTIESGQAFLVLSNGAAGSISFTEDAKIPGSNLVSRESGLPESEIRTNLYVMHNGGQVLIDGVANQFNEVYANDVDVQDAPKLGNLSETFSIMRDGKLLAVERRTNITATDTIYFNLGQLRARDYVLEINPALMPGGLQAWLEDLHLGTATPVSMEQITQYPFKAEASAPGSYAADRFRLVFRRVLAPLPVTFIETAATRNRDASVRVTWKVDNETSMEKYEVERSYNGQDFTGIITRTPEANNGSGATYRETDLGASKSGLYYRIKGVSASGLVQYSRVVRVDEISADVKLVLYPNPVTDGRVNLEANGLEAGEYIIRIVNAIGQEIANSKIQVRSPREVFKLQLPSGAHGSCMVQVLGKNGFKKTMQMLVK